MAFDVGDLSVKLGVDAASLQADMNKALGVFGRGMKDMHDAATHVGNQLGWLLGGQMMQSLDLLARRGVEAFGVLKRSAIDTADELNKMSQKVGFSVESLSALKYAATLSDVSLEGLGNGLKGLSQNMAEARGGSKEMAALFGKLGISLDSSDEALLQLADRFSRMPDGFEKTALAVKLFGKAGMDMIPFLNQGRDGIGALTEEARRFGLVVGGVAAQQAEAFNDNLTRLSANAQGLLQVLGSAMVPTLLSATEKFLEAKAASGGFDDQMRAIIGTQDEVEDALESTAQVLANLYNMMMPVIVGGRLVYDVLKGIALEGAAWAAQIVALKEGNIAGFKEIGIAAEEDADKLRKSSDEFIASIVASANGANATVAKFFEEHRRTVRVGNQTYLMESVEDAKKLQAAMAAVYKVKPVSGATGVLDEQGKAAAKVKSAYDELKKSLIDKIAAQEADLNSVDKLTGADKEYTQFITSITAGTLKLTPLELANAAALWDKYINTSRLNEEEKVYLKAQEEIAAAERKRIDEFIKATDTLNDQVKKAREENEEIGLTVEALNQLKLSRMDVAIATQEQYYATAQMMEPYARETEELGKQIEALKELRTLAASSQVKTANAKALDDQTKAWEKFSDDIERSLTDALMRSFEAGDNFGEAFVKSLQNTLKTAVLKYTVQAVVDPITGKGGLLQSALGSGSGGSQLFGAASTGNSIYNLATGNVGGGLYGSFATSAVGETIGLSAPTYAGIAGVEDAIGAALTPLGTALPYIGAAVAAISLLSGMGTGGTPHKGGVAFSDSNTDLAATNMAQATTMMGQPDYQSNEWYKAPELGAAMLPVAAAFADTLNSVRNRYGLNDAKVGMGFSADGEDKSRGVFHVFATPSGNTRGALGPYGQEQLVGAYDRFDSDAQKGMQQYTASLSRYMITALAASDLSAPINTYLEKFTGAISEGSANAVAAALNSDWIDPFLEQMDVAGQSFDAITAEIVRFSEIATLKPLFDALSVDIYDFGSDIAQAFGGASNAGAAMSAYYEAYYSEQDRAGKTAELMAEQFAKLGMSMPETKDGFRALVEGLDLTTASGAQTYASLLNIAPAFATVANAAAEASTVLHDSVTEMITSLSAPLDASKLTTIINSIFGTAFDALPTRDLAESWLISLSDADIDVNAEQLGRLREIWEPLNAVWDGIADAATEAADTLAEALTEMGGEATASLDSLGVTVSELGMTDLEKELAGVDRQAGAYYATLVELGVATADNVTAITSWSTAMKGQLEVIADAAHAQEVLDERKGLQDQLDELTLTSTQLLGKQRDALDDSNRGLFDQIVNIKAANTAMEDLASQIETIAGVRGDIASGRQGIVSSMAGFDAVGYYDAQQATLNARFSSAATTPLKAQLAGELMQSIDSGLQAQIDALDKTHDLRLTALQDEATLIEDNAAKAKQAAQEMFGALDGIAKYAAGLKVGNLSTLSPEDRLAAAGSEYQRLLGAAQGGDSNAASQLTGASDAYLGLAKDYYASTSAYSDIFASVEGQLIDLGRQASVYEQIANSTAAAYDLQAQTAAENAAYQSALLALQNASLAKYDALGTEMNGFQASLEYRLDDTVINLQSLGVSTDTVGSKVTQSQVAITASLERVNAATQQSNALMQQMIALLQQANATAASSNASLNAVASNATLAAAA